MSKPLFEELIAKSVACDLPATATPYVQLKALWDLFQFLDETDILDIGISAINKLHELEPKITDEQKELLRQDGYAFPEDWDNPREFFHGAHD